MPMKTLLLAAAALATVALAPAASAQSAGDWVLAPWRTGNYLFPGVIQSASGGQVVVRFDDGTSATLPRRSVRRFNWREGTAVQCRWQNGQRWYPGRITAMGRDGATMEVLYADGDSERTNTGRCRVPA